VIDRVTQRYAALIPTKSTEVPFQIAPGRRVWNFPRASQLTITLLARYTPLQTTEGESVINGQMVLGYGVGNPPDFGLIGSGEQQRLPIARQIATNQLGATEATFEPVTFTLQRAFDALAFTLEMEGGTNVGVAATTELLVEVTIEVARPEDLGAIPVIAGGR
jgi:hypothetical protein